MRRPRATVATRWMARTTAAERRLAGSRSDLFVDGRLLVEDGVGGSLHLGLELVVHLRFVPLFILDVLHPFEIADRHAAGVGEDVRQHRNAFAKEDAIRGRRGRSPLKRTNFSW